MAQLRWLYVIALATSQAMPACCFTFVGSPLSRAGGSRRSQRAGLPAMAAVVPARLNGTAVGSVSTDQIRVSEGEAMRKEPAGEGSPPGETQVHGEPAEGTDASWSEFQDWLIQDTYSRYAIGSGRHVMWRRMVMEVPELMDRSPEEVRLRWLDLTGRRRGGGAAAMPPPALDPLETFYLQPPILEDWEENPEGSGGFKGHVFGQKGLADGSAITTASVDVTGRCIQDQYITTLCGVVYELGADKGSKSAPEGALEALARHAPAAALAASAAVVGATVLAHHIQLEVFVV